MSIYAFEARCWRSVNILTLETMTHSLWVIQKWYHEKVNLILMRQYLTVLPPMKILSKYTKYLKVKALHSPRKWWNNFFWSPDDVIVERNFIISSKSWILKAQTACIYSSVLILFLTNIQKQLNGNRFNQLLIFLLEKALTLAWKAKPVENHH